MPLVALTISEPKSAVFKAPVLDAVHAALVASGVPLTDKFQRVIELASEDFRFDPFTPTCQTRAIMILCSLKACGRLAAASKSSASC